MFILILIALLIPFSILSLYFVSGYEKIIRNELNTHIIHMVSRSEADVDALYYQMIYISNALASNTDFLDILKDKDASLYEQTLVFDSMVNALLVNYPSFNSDLKITAIDTEGKVFANWSKNFHDYTFLSELEAVQQSKAAAKHIVWMGVEPSFILEDNQGKRFITLARSEDADVSNPDFVCTFILSMSQESFSSAVSRYFPNAGDFAFLRQGDGTILFPLGFPPVLEGRYEALQLSEENGLVTLGDAKYLIYTERLDNSWLIGEEPLRIQFFINYQGIEEQLSRLVSTVRISLLFLYLTLLGVIAYFSVHVIKPISSLSKKISNYSVSKPPTDLDSSRKDEIGQINRSFLTMAENNTNLFHRLKEESLKKEQFYYESMRAQVNPHFLFNALTTIRWMALLKKADNIVDSINSLADILRFSMDKSKEYVLLREEIHTIRSYVSLQNYQHGSRFILFEKISPELLEYEIIKFILQPIVENSVMHAFPQRKQGCEIRIEGSLQQKEGREVLLLSVSDNGVGMSEADIACFVYTKQHGYRREVEKSGIGLLTVDERIHIQYGDPYGLSITSEEKVGTTVWYTLPASLSSSAEGEDGILVGTS